MQPIDLRSDTVTRPTPAMREAMFAAAVGDDVFDEDPTVKQLEAEVAEVLGLEAALFVPSGTMSNQIGLAAQTAPADEVILESNSHVIHYESGAAGVISGLQLRAIEGVRGEVTPEAIRAAVRPGYYWEPNSRVLALENTNNRAGGLIFGLAPFTAAVETARELGLRVHLDGARLWNAAVATGLPERAWASQCDTVSVCLSKGLGAPVGSVLAGSAETIKRAHTLRKRLGGGMRQVGILAEAGRYALTHHRARLLEDHRNARTLAEGFAALPGFRVDMDLVQTNIVMIDTEAPALTWIEKFAGAGVKMVPFGPHRLRATTHLDVSAADIDTALSRIRAVV